jgi:hypothetical protein
MFNVKHPLFHVGETCYACIPVSTGVQLIECDITGPLVSRAIRDLDGQLIGYAQAYKVLLEGAVREIPFAERDLRKKWQRSDWGMLRGIWHPDRTRHVSRPTAWKEFK